MQAAATDRPLGVRRRLRCGDCGTCSAERLDLEHTLSQEDLGSGVWPPLASPPGACAGGLPPRKGRPAS